jgi:hypothetical protein
MTGAGLRSLTYFGTLALSLLAAGEWLARRVHPLPDAPPAIGTPLEYADTNYTAIDDDAALWRTAATADADTDALGLRAPHGEDPLGDAVRVLVLGDANAFGADVDGSRTYCARAQEFFDRAFGRGTIAIKNGAVIGHTVVQGAAWFESRFADWRPDLVVIAYGNGVELEPARADRSDAEWIDAAHELRTRSPLRAIDVCATHSRERRRPRTLPREFVHRRPSSPTRWPRSSAACARAARSPCCSRRPCPRVALARNRATRR